MNYHFTYKIDELFAMVNLETIAISDRIGSDSVATLNRLADVIPLTNDDIIYFNIFLNRGGARVFEAMAAYAETVDSDGNEIYPYYITDETDTTYPKSIVYKISLHTDVKPAIAIPLITSTICKALVTFIIKEWLKLKGFNDMVTIKEIEFENSLSDIKRGLTFGIRATKTYRTF